MDAEKLKAELAALGWTQRYFSERYGCDQDTVSRWCTGKVPVPAHVGEYFRVVRLAAEILRP
ncbi:helix-turn-helix transcriptional regulator [Orrella sp. JC864]|uniref:helix-turn-helix domain-containing protein n=1 Tax=Orrella sp. JC864 TaxID=3120298 RepID=UPI0030088B9F